MLRLKTLVVPLALVVGALGGYLAASGQLTSMFRAKATAQAVPTKDDERKQQFVAHQDDKKAGKNPRPMPAGSRHRRRQPRRKCGSRQTPNISTACGRASPSRPRVRP